MAGKWELRDKNKLRILIKMQSAALGWWITNLKTTCFQVIILSSLIANWTTQYYFKTHPVGQTAGVHVENEDANSVFISASHHKTETLLRLHNNFNLKKISLSTGVSTEVMGEIVNISGLPHSLANQNYNYLLG